MPFGLPEYDRAFSLFLSEAINEVARAGDPLLAQIEVEESPGALGSVFEDDSGRDVPLDPGSSTADLTLDANAVREGNIDDLVLQITFAAGQVREDLGRMLFATLNTVTEATGNVVRGRGQPTFETLYAALEKMEWGLTDDDKLSMPTIVMNPADAQKLPQLTSEQEGRLHELQERKLNELLAGRRRRRLS